MTDIDPAATLHAKLDAAKAAKFEQLVHTRTELMIAVLRDLRVVLDELDVLRQTILDFDDSAVIARLRAKGYLDVPRGPKE